MKYRAEIDGLRALAIVPVVLFHAGFASFSGGYVGVDIFFVISGYLITSILYKDFLAGHYSIAHFYERRARRILPALFLVMLVCLPFAWLWLLPDDLKDFAQSVTAVPLFVSNLHFLAESSYFGTASELKPLLHTWSLAVEEQFYVLFPLLFIALCRRGGRFTLRLFAVIGLGSLLLAEWLSSVAPEANFFILPTRAWELLIGAAIAVRETRGGIPVGRPVGDLLGWAGLGMIVFSIFAFDADIPFPGIYALVPTLGTGLIIAFASQENTIGRMLSLRLLVGVGLISYSAYLWHQPMFAFARHVSLEEPSEALFGVLIILTFALAYFSWRFVEQPFRQSGRISRRALVRFAVGGTLFFIIIGIAGNASKGFKNRTLPGGESMAVLDERLRANYGLHDDCDRTPGSVQRCMTDESPEVLVWGDSYAMHLVQGMTASNPSVKLIQATKSTCGPLLGLAPIPANRGQQWAGKCLEFNDDVRSYVEGQSSLRYAVLSSPLEHYIATDTGLLTTEGATAADEAIVREHFLATLDFLASLGIRPLVVTPPPKGGADIGRCLAKRTRFAAPLDGCDFPQDSITDRQGEVYRFLRDIEQQYPVLWLDRGICQDGICRASVDGVFVYRDDGHLSVEGSRWLGKEMGFYRQIRDAAAESATAK